jgi:glycosyltransferase involved in cell wall biosynthesis
MEKVFSSKDFVSNPIASVLIITYNQVEYISQTIESVLEQEVNFDFEIILVDDCSNDETNRVCLDYQLKYPKQIKFISNEKNKGIARNYHESIKNFCSGKYIAQCAGDDYWVTKDKLQKQVDILETDESIGIVHTQILSLRVRLNEIRESTKDRSSTSFENLLIYNCISAPTVCFRKSLYLLYLKEIDPLTKYWIVEDTPMWLYFSIFSKIHFINERTVVYRVIAGSVSNTDSSRKHYEFVKSRLSIKKYFIDKYNGSQHALKFIYDDFYKESEYHAIKLKEIETIKENVINLRSNGLVLKPYYLKLMCKMHLNKYAYKLLFFFYKIYNRLILLKDKKLQVKRN